MRSLPRLAAAQHTWDAARATGTGGSGAGADGSNPDVGGTIYDAGLA
jgi:hypothetical protein